MHDHPPLCWLSIQCTTAKEPLLLPKTIATVPARSQSSSAHVESFSSKRQVFVHEYIPIQGEDKEVVSRDVQMQRCASDVEVSV